MRMLTSKLVLLLSLFEARAFQITHRLRFHRQQISLSNKEMPYDEPPTTDRRTWLSGVAGTLVATNVFPAHAFDNKAYPDELVMTDAGDRDPRRDKVQTILDTTKQREGPPKPTSSVLWGSALWFLTGSRSTPIATPLANLLYDEKQEWLKDRNDGLFAKLPWEFLVILGAVFCGLGFGVDALVSLVADGNPDASIQLAGVGLIGGCSLELGRIASGQKKQTRVENDRSELLLNEFDTFAKDRLTSGGNCHRTEVVQAFRRYYAKYRQADSTQFPLSDLEIEELLRSYGRSVGVKMSPSGFYVGIQINQEADAFVKR